MWKIISVSADIDLGSYEKDWVTGDYLYRVGVEGSIEVFGLGIEGQLLRGTAYIDENFNIVSESFEYFDGKIIIKWLDTEPAVFNVPGTAFKLGLGVGVTAGFDEWGYFVDSMLAGRARRHNAIHDMGSF